MHRARGLSRVFYGAACVQGHKKRVCSRSVGSIETRVLGKGSRGTTK
jgi:hypothetical protein